MRMMGMVVAAVVVGVGFAGCAGPISARQDDIQQGDYPQVHVDAYSLHEAMVVQKPIVHRVGVGQLDVTIPIRNKWDRALHLQYQYYFVDEQGARTEDASPWMPLTIPRKGFDQAHFTSLTPAADFHVEFQEIPNYHG